MTRDMKLPLSGFVVVELTDNASAPFGGEILAQLGAEVWKVERPGGDASRRWGSDRCRGASSSYHVLNRGKQCLCLDIKNEAELARLHQLIDDKADVFIHNLRPGTSGKYRLDATTLRRRKPSLVYCEVGAFGHVGPMREEPGYDPLMQAFSGIMSLTGDADRPPSRSGVSIIDLGTGTWAALGIVVALLRRQTQGTGATVNCSLFETALAWMALSLGTHAAGGKKAGRLGSGIGFIAPSRAYMTADGYLMVSCANDHLFGKLCGALGRPDWATDARFATNSARLQHRAALDALLESRLAQHPRAVWQERLLALGVPSAPVQEVEEVFQCEQVRALAILQSPAEDEMPVIGLPLSFDGERPPPLSPAGDLGQANHRLGAHRRSVAEPDGAVMASPTSA